MKYYRDASRFGSVLNTKILKKENKKVAGRNLPKKRYGNAHFIVLCFAAKRSSIYDVHKKLPIFWPPLFPTIRKNEQYIYCLKTQLSGRNIENWANFTLDLFFTFLANQGSAGILSTLLNIYKGDLLRK